MTAPPVSQDSRSPANRRRSKEAIVAFNALETRNRDLLAALSWVVHPDPLAALRRALQEWFQQENVFFAPSGECAIAQILALLPQPEVVMPAWICHEVKTAARVAGKRIVYVDLAPGQINATAEEYSRVARPGQILLIAHLFGAPTDVSRICELAKSRDCVTIEDAVPAIGGREGGRLLGTFADFGVFSFEKSKRIPAFRGGFIVANNGQLIEPGELARFRLTPSSTVLPILPLATALAQNLATHPPVYRAVTSKFLPLRPRVVEALRSLKRRQAAGVAVGSAGTADAEQTATHAPAPRTPFYTRELHPYQAELALRMIRRIDQIGQKIARLAGIYMEKFRNSPIATLLPPGCDVSGLMRFPVAFPGKQRAEILKRAWDQGIYLKVMWAEGVGLEGLPNSLWVAQNLVLLPLYTALGERSAQCLADAIVEIDRSTPPGSGA